MIIHSFQDLIDLFRGQKFSFSDYYKFKNLKYNILSIGQNCFPRVLCSFAKLKPTKIYGELSCPFDLAYYYNIDTIINLIDNNFEDFFKDFIFDKKENTYVNYSLFINFAHDGILSKQKFIERYKKRIENFNYYMNNEKPLVIMFYASSQITEQQVLRLYDVIKRKRNGKPFRIVIAHSSDINFENKPQELLLVDNIDIFKLEKTKCSWIKLMKEKYRKEYPMAENIYSRTVGVLNQAINEVCD